MLCVGWRISEVVLCPILYCIDVFSTYLGKILDFVVVHWSFIFVSHVSQLIVELILGHTYIIVHAFAFLDTFFLLLQADRAYGTEISPRSFVISFVILLYAISYNICI